MSLGWEQDNRLSLGLWLNSPRRTGWFGARSKDAHYPSLKAFLRHGTFERTELVRIYRVAACNTRIEIPATPPDYERIDATEALALLRELPDPRMVHRLHLSDEPSFLDPWIRHVSGREVQHLGNATSTGIVVLYRPDRRHSDLGVTLLHEWLHLVAFKSGWTLRRSKRAHAIISSSAFSPMSNAPRRKSALGSLTPRETVVRRTAYDDTHH
jgi:hypothetical protein